MKLLVVSHACVTPVNQSFFADVQSLTNWEVSILLPRNWKTEYSDKPVVPKQWSNFKGSLHIVPVILSGNIPLHVYRSSLGRYIQKVDADAIYVHNEPYAMSTVQLYMANQLAGRRPIGFYTAQNIHKSYPFPFRNLESWVFRQSSFSFPVTEGALAVARDKGYSGPAEVLPLAVDSELYSPNKEFARKKRAELNIDDQETVIGFIGRLVAEKGLATLIEALPLLGNRRFRCVLVGSGPNEQHIRQLVAARSLQDRVIFTGYVPHIDAPNWLSLFDICVLPSRTTRNWKEQFGRVILEAIACGTPVVGSDSGEIPALLRKVGSGDSIFPEGNAGELANRLARLCDTPALGQNIVVIGQRVIRECFDQHGLVSRFAAAIEKAHGCFRAQI